MSFDILKEMEKQRGDNYRLHKEYLNAQLVRVLNTIGYDRFYERGEGAYLIDSKGDRYLDFLSGFGVFALGRSHPVIKKALFDILDADLPALVQLDCALLPGMLGEALLAKAPPSINRCFFANSGTEAIEAAIKFVRYATGRSRILYCNNSYHGLTYGSLSVSGAKEFRQGFEPFLPDCEAVPFGDIDALKQALAIGDVAAFFFEPIQGKGVNMPPEGYFREVQQLCRQYDTLIVADEVQTGLGRTGKFFAFEHWGIEPDVIAIAKALSGGYVPVGSVLCRGDIFGKVFHRMDRALVHGSTFGKNPLAMAAGLATLHVLEEEKLVENAAQMGDLLISMLQPLAEKYDFLYEVRGKGLMIGLEFRSPRSLKLKIGWTMLETAQKGLFSQLITVPLFQRHRILTQVAGNNMNVIKILPPFIITEQEVNMFVSAFEDVLADCHRYPGTIWDFGSTLVKQAMKKS
ncbi:MAG: aspartate aminotransferase family protein [Hydrococcus sp. Prado102]|jgi:ornithine--oxo-acid transaminase|nr:aspartate aminotransferase family protein [Hydrococcus sp. Prado102]